MRTRIVRTWGVALLLVAGTAATDAGHAESWRAAPLRYDDALAAVAERGFAGAWLDERGDLVVALTRPDGGAARAARADLARLLGRRDLAAKRVSAVPARYSFRQLRGWYDAVRADVFAIAGVRTGDVDERANVVRVGVSDVARLAPAVTAVARRHGVPADAVVVADAGEITLTSLDGQHRPLAGGTRIAAVGYCSLGFPAVRAGQKGFVTASHCTYAQGEPDGAVFNQPTLAITPVGREAWDPPAVPGGCTLPYPCRNADAAFVALLDDAHFAPGRIARPATTGTTAWNGTDTFRVTTTAAAPVLGDTLTKVGRTSGMSSGNVNATCVDTLWPLPNASGGPIQSSSPGDSGILVCQDYARYGSLPGDSGAPVFVASGTDAALAGVNWGSGSNTGGAYAMFSRFSNIEADLGPLDVCATGYAC